ncbi:MAG: DUF6258 family protein [Terracidiphilus sp.]
MKGHQSAGRKSGEDKFSESSLTRLLTRKHTMLPSEFLKTVYLGDRACKSITIDTWGKRVLIQIDEISRIRSASGRWDFYNGENIVDGLLVFADVKSIFFDPPGPLPNDFINYLEAVPMPDDLYRFTLSIGSVDDSAKTSEIVLTIEAKHIYLEDPQRPGVLIDC